MIRRPSILICLLLGTIGVACSTQQSDPRSSEIEDRTSAYVAAFNQNDAETLATFWADDAGYTNPRSGLAMQGRDAILEMYSSYFEESKGTRLAVKIESITFPAPNTAVERGTATISEPGKEAIETNYRVDYSLIEGQWLITRVSEVEVLQATSNHEKLQGLDWLLGEWIDADEDVKVTTTFAWDKYLNFLTQKFDVHVLGKEELHGRQVIAWDPANEKIRSWVFDSDGGFGEGTWTQDGDSWIVESSYTLSDGRRGSSINIYTQVDANSYSFESTGREIDGELLPDIDPVIVKRKEG